MEAQAAKVVFSQLMATQAQLDIVQQPTDDDVQAKLIPIDVSKIDYDTAPEFVEQWRRDRPIPAYDQAIVKKDHTYDFHRWQPFNYPIYHLNRPYHGLVTMVFGLLDDVLIRMAVDMEVAEFRLPRMFGIAEGFFFDADAIPAEIHLIANNHKPVIIKTKANQRYYSIGLAIEAYCTQLDIKFICPVDKKPKFKFIFHRIIQRAFDQLEEHGYISKFGDYYYKYRDQCSMWQYIVNNN